MSHLIQEYAKSCGVKIGKPQFKAAFYPVVADKYITIHHATCPATTYAYWGEVFGILLPILDKKGIKIIQLLDNQEQKIQSANSHIQCSKKQAASIIQNSLAHIGVDSIYCHIAGNSGVPLVGIYSHTNPDNTRPWNIKEPKTKEICSFGEKKPSYDPRENPRTINSIKPEEIAANILAVLGIKKEIKFKTLFIGDRYMDQCLDVVPFAPSEVCANKINVRMDINHDEKILLSVLQNNFAEVTLSSPISDDLLAMRRISIVNYIAEEFDEVFAKKIKSLGIHLNLLCVSEEKLANQRFKFFQYDVHFHDLKAIAQQNASRIQRIANKKIKTKSNKRILIGNKEYYSYLDALKSKELFLLDLDWLYIYTIE